MERAKIIKDEIVERNIHFLAVRIETGNSLLVLLSEKEDKLGTLAIAVPKPSGSLGQPTSSVLLGNKEAILARAFAEQVASKKNKIALVSIYLETMDLEQAQVILKKLMDKVIQAEGEKEGMMA